MFKYKAIAKIIAGAALMIVAVIALVAWLGACFGTVIVGIALLFLAPQILLLPFTLIGTPAMALIAIGMEELVEDNETRSPPPPHLENMEYRRNARRLGIIHPKHVRPGSFGKKSSLLCYGRSSGLSR